jgi:hypothetical protein
MEAGQYFLTSPTLALEEQRKTKSPTFQLWPRAPNPKQCGRLDLLSIFVSREGNPRKVQAPS